MEGMDPRHLGMMGKKSMELHNYPDALRLFSMGLAQLESLNLPRKFAAPFFMDRAECFWQLGNVEGALQEMENALRHGLPREDFFAEDESSKWSDHGYALLERNKFAMAERCAKFALYFHTSPRTRAQAFLCQVTARYEMGQITGETKETKEIKRLDPNLAKLHAQERKDDAIKNMQSLNYQWAIKSFIFALLLHPEDGSKMKFKRSVESHLANAYFKLKRYKRAVEFGEESYKSNPNFRSTEEAERWKKRGNDLSKEPSLVDQAIACYSLALQFTPAEEKDLKGTIFSNRSLMYNKQGKADQALGDAQNCVENKSGWPKAHYRLGSCLLAQRKYRDAMKPFSRSLKLLLSDASRLEHHAIDTLNQLLYVALKLPDGTSSIQYGIPKTYIQTVINKAVNDKDWATLHLLYLGGGGPTQFEKGSGGLAAGCDASSVPLIEVVSCDFLDLEKFVSILLDHKARDTPQEGRKTALELAIDLNKFDVAGVLMERNTTSGPRLQFERKFKEDAKKAREKGDNNKAIELFKLSLTQEGNTTEEQRTTLQTLCELYFQEKAFEDCLRIGRKLKKALPKGYKNEDKATQWKNWGNKLNEEREYNLMAEYYTLAIEFTPTSKTELLASLLSNRCLALNNLKKFEEALEDAKECTKVKPKWFRGYSRQGTCLRDLNKTREALRAFCKAHTHALNDKEKQITATDVITTAMLIEGGESQITCTLSPQVLQFLVKDASEKKEWKKLRFLYLGSIPSPASRGLAIECECDASCVPLDLLIKSDVEDIHSLVKSLLQHKASVDGLRGCAKPPLLAAMEMMNFPLAVTLLRNNADPACIVGHGIFINREGQPKQWLQLGRKAVDANDSKKAVMLLNMSLYLSHSNTDRTINAQIYHALAEAYFIGSEHERCIDAGKECFKIQPVKSEEEAKRWGERANQTFHLRNYNLSIDYLNQALMYTPADSRETFSHLLCRRSEAYQQLKNFQSGLEDAVNASKICPRMSEVYLHQLKCFQALKRKKEAMHAANECLKRTTDEDFINGLLCDALATAASLEEGTSALTAPVPSKLLEKLVSDVIKKKKWRKLRILYLGGGGPGSQATGYGGLATGINASSVPLGEIICSNVPERLILVSVLLKHGASANGIEESDKIPLEEAMRPPNLPLVEKLVQNGANPCVMSKEGEPIIHQALKIGLQKNGKFEFLKAMLKSTLPEVQSVQDTDGNTLYHIACFGKNVMKKKYDAIRILREANINPNLRNKRNEYPIDKVPSKRDPRWKMLDTALQCYKSSSLDTDQSSSSDTVTHKNNPEKVSDEQDQDLQRADREEEEQVSSGNEEKATTGASNTPQNVNVWKIDHKQRQREERTKTIGRLIDDIKPLSTFVPHAIDTNEEHDDIEIFNESSGSPQTAESIIDVVKKDETVFDDRDVDENEIIADNYIETDIDSKSPFEDLPWEVDCTDRVWKIMRNKKVGVSTRRRIIDKIRMLANGRWSKTLCKRLEGEAKRKDIELYESKITKGQRIIWEKTIAFSGRCSENPELRLNKKTHEGRIYSDIIRVWDIVLDHDKLDRSIDLIVKSHDRGMDCIVKRKLKGIPVKSGGNSVLTSECLPNSYEEIGDLGLKGNPPAKESAPKKSTIADNLPQIFFPPASANEQEYHILKFYSFSTALVKTVLESDISSRIDFPFKITELEHAIVNLRPDPPVPIILLGRSGTGKTTCCLYRLWNQFQSYWESAETAGPHFPRYLPPPLKIGQCSNDDETLQGKIEQNVNQAECSQEQASPECQQTNALSYLVSASTLQNDDQVQVMQSNSRSTKVQNQLDLEEKKQTDMYEHLHQIFITKNNVLCSEVEKNFKELCHACPAAQHRIPFEDQPLPAKIQNIAEGAWPLFVNSRDWLLRLDASLPGKTFFKRDEDGSLLRKIDGWGGEDSHLQFIPAAESDDESDHEEEDEGLVGTQHDSVDTKQKGKETSFKEDRDPRREITYPVFQFELWPKMKKTSKERVDYHPTLVWTEIRSFIKGSAEALLGENGELSLEDYESLGKKKAPNFSADRKVIYDLYRVYKRERSSKRMFDEADLVYNIHKRLQLITAPEWSVHQFYVDETQDFTQAELSLLIRCCRDPNQLFFTGDTAQSIMRGISFRFSDLKSLFHHARKAAGITDDLNDFIRVPKKLYQLTHNYRSHAGILRLASSVVDLLLRYFPDSFDKLQKDEGLFEGPRPVLLESCSPSDLAMILQGNQRQSSRIEFGAHQVVLVASNEARETLPEELSHGLVMTIYEAKGLEFDDVLIYNFFKDSQATKEWRVVASFMRDEGFTNLSSSTGLAEITEDSVTAQSSRPLEFDPDKHKVLNSELKYLYTAITRARVNVWFFDEDKESRAPMFEFFQKCDLVKVVSMGDGDTGSGELASMCATKSTPDEWRKGGLRFYKRKLWRLAIQCFEFAGDERWVQKSRAQQQAAEAIKLRSTNRQQMKDEFLKAGESFLKCDMYDEAEICLNNAREWTLLARLYEKTGKFQDAARLFKKEKLHKEASRCYEAQNNYAEAIEVFCRAGIFEEALSALERYYILASSGDLEAKHGIIPPRSTRTTERLRHQLANQHFKRGETIKMEEVLQYLPSATDRITFLKKRGCIIEAARALDADGRRDEAARLLKDAGKFEEAERYSTDPKFSADCLISLARTTTKNDDSLTILERAIEKYQLCGDLNGQAEALLLLGGLSDDSKKLQDAGRLFDKSKNPCGEVESVMQLLETTNFVPPKTFQQWMAVRALERVLGLITRLHMPQKKLTLAEESEIIRCEEHFGLFKTNAADENRYLCKSGGRFSTVYPQIIENHTSNTEVMINTLDAHKKIGRFLLNVCAKLVEMIHVMLEKTLARSTPCTKMEMGTTCGDSSCENQHEDTLDHFNNRFLALFHFVYLESVVESFKSEIASRKDEQETLKLNLEGFRGFRACQRFYDFLVPSSGYREYHLSLGNIRRLNKTKLVTKRIFQFANVLWKENAEELRRSDTNNFLKVSFCLQLINSSHFTVKWICEEEKKFEKKTRTPKFRPTSELLAKNGMTGPDEIGRYESYLQWWEYGKKRLYVYGDVQNAAHIIIRRFLTLTAKRSKMRYPSIANTVMILEHQLTACLALYSRLTTENRVCPVCLPAGYLTMVRFWDNCRPGADKGTLTLYQAVENSYAQEADKIKLSKAVRSLLDYMVTLTCGQVAHSFDVLGDALDSGESSSYCDSGEAERTLVLFLTMMCNCGKGISIHLEELMLKKILRIKSNPRLTSRINRELDKIQEAQGSRDVVMILKTFLKSRAEELYDLRWYNGKLWYDGACNPTTYPNTFHTDLSHIREGLKQDQGQEKTSEDTETVNKTVAEASEERMDVKPTEEELKEKENILRDVNATTIQRWYKRMKSLEKKKAQAGVVPAKTLHRLEPTQKQINSESDVLEKHFSQFRVDLTACGICGISFKPSAEDTFHMNNEDNEGETASTDNDAENAEIHGNSSAHLVKEKAYFHYKDIYLSKVQPLFTREKQLLKVIKDHSLSAKVELDMERVETSLSVVKSEVQNVESTLNWEKVSPLQNAVTDSEIKLQKTEKVVEQAKQESFTAANEDSEPEEEEDGLHEEDKEEEHDFSPIQEIPHGNKKGSGKSKKRRKNRKK